MSDDKKISELISKSLRIRLSEQEESAVNNHLEANPEAKKFADISKCIQDSIAFACNEEEDCCLNEQMKSRLKDSIASAVAEKQSLSQAGLFAATQDLNSGSTFLEQIEPDNEHRKLNTRFKLIRRLGQGGLGNVWLARDEQLNRSVAIKELNREALQSPKAWQRFQREAEITGHLEHPNVVPLYQYGIDQEKGEPFYAMRFVGKRTLADAIIEHHDRVEAGEDKHLGLHRLLDIFKDVCQAIAYAHSRGVIHRDLKPENVALDNFGQVIVLDWGLAKVFEDSELSYKISQSPAKDFSLSNTMEGEVIGTPRFMAPEQAAGELEKIDEKTDIYGLGATLFAILTGKAPHEKTLQEQSSGNLSTILKLIADGETPIAGDMGKSVPRELEAICTKAMSTKRHLRFDSVQQLAAAVESWMVGQNRKQANYDNLRMEGRELRAEMQSSIRDYERNARFMSQLPPIQQLIDVDTEEEIAVWRDRLSTIFTGLMKTNQDYRSIVYYQVKDGEARELVRVERHTSDLFSVRVVPKSRLRSDQASDYLNTVLEQKPEEVWTALTCEPFCSTGETLGLAVSVPVFDENTEEVFGAVTINCDIRKRIADQFKRRIAADEIIIACDTFHIMAQYKDRHTEEKNLGQKVAERAPYFVNAMESLQDELEFIDETDAEVYGSRLWFHRRHDRKHGIVYLLRRE